ncbi:MAG: hypothetical protein ACXVWF_09325 [Actinomycetota bacterium]
MGTWLLVWLIVAMLVPLVAIAAFVAALVRHGLVVGRSAQRLQAEVGPLAEEITRETARQGERLSSLKGPGRRSGEA